MKFYRFNSEFEFNAKKAKAELNGLHLDVIGKIPTGTESLQWVEVQAPDGGLNLTEMMAPDYRDGWHVNASSAVEGWEKFEVSPAQPVRIFA